MAYKTASVLMSLVVILISMMLGYEIGGVYLSLFVGFISAVSSIFLTFSRLGDYLVVIPLLTSMLGYYMVRFAKKNNLRDTMLASIVSSFGLFAAPHTAILPILFVG